MDKIIFFSRFF